MHRPGQEEHDASPEAVVDVKQPRPLAQLLDAASSCPGDLPLVSFTVVGAPAPQGSKRALVHRHTGRAVLIESSSDRVRTWREDVRAVALEHCTEPVRGAVSVFVQFRLARPKHHYGTGRNAGTVRTSAPMYPAGKPDLDKLVRATLDALTGVVFVDDSQVVRLVTSKSWANQAGALISVMEVEP